MSPAPSENELMSPVTKLRKYAPTSGVAPDQVLVAKTESLHVAVRGSVEAKPSCSATFAAKVAPLFLLQRRYETLFSWNPTTTRSSAATSPSFMVRPSEALASVIGAGFAALATGATISAARTAMTSGPAI